MGGSQSHEFMVATDAGEDFVVSCPATGYAANLEKAVSRAVPPAVADPEGDLAPEKFHTPNRKTIAEVAEFTGLPGNVADEEPGDGVRRQACAGAAARRSSA